MIYVSFNEAPGNMMECGVRFDTDFEAQALLAGQSMPFECDIDIPMTLETQIFIADLIKSAAIARLKGSFLHNGRS